MATLPTSAPALSFSFSTTELRVVMRDGEPWFVAADVCAALTIGNNRDALGRLDDDEKGVGSIDTPGGAQQMVIINESGLYSLILGSRKPEAKRFKKWVTSEVLPAIRKTGRYETAATITPGQQQTIKAMVEALAQAAEIPLDEVWGQLHLRFGIAQYGQLPAAKFDDACDYLRNEAERDVDAVADMVRRAFLRGRRFLLSFDHLGRAQVDQVQPGYAVVGCDEIPVLVASGFVPRALLSDVATAAIKKLAG